MLHPKALGQDADSHGMYRQSVRTFIQKHIAPNYEQWEKAEIFPRSLWNNLGEAGFLAADLPPRVRRRRR